LSRLRPLLLLLPVVALLALGSTQAGAHTTAVKKLYGTVGPGFTIKLTTKNLKKKLTKVKPGRYTFLIFDKATTHNFHLKGPGVNKMTTIRFLGTKVWKRLKLKKGTYKYWCDPHRTTMHGSFKVG
jgi:plastocyanin